jgi:hypothetical protein
MNLQSILKRVLGLSSDIAQLNEQLTETRNELASLKVMLGSLHARLPENTIGNASQPLHAHEFKVFSQWGDDGIIQYLINNIDITDKSFVEFGVQNYTECNTRFLLINNNWRGLIMDGSERHMKSVQQDDIYWKHNIKAVPAFITKENINQLLTEQGFIGEIGLLHIDIDGNDYWVWQAVNVVNPVIVIVEYNSLLGKDNAWTVPYKADFVRTNAHHSNLYYGVSIKALCILAEEKGYAFVGCNSNGNNAYFVRKDKIGNLKALTVEEGYVASQFSEGRNENGELTFLRGESRYEVLKGLPIINVATGKTETIS